MDFIERGRSQIWEHHDPGNPGVLPLETVSSPSRNPLQIIEGQLRKTQLFGPEKKVDWSTIRVFSFDAAVLQSALTDSGLQGVDVVYVLSKVYSDDLHGTLQERPRCVYVHVIFSGSSGGDYLQIYPRAKDCDVRTTDLEVDRMSYSQSGGFKRLVVLAAEGKNPYAPHRLRYVALLDIPGDWSRHIKDGRFISDEEMQSAGKPIEPEVIETPKQPVQTVIYPLSDPDLLARGWRGEAIVPARFAGSTNQPRIDQTPPARSQSTWGRLTEVQQRQPKGDGPTLAERIRRKLEETPAIAAKIETGKEWDELKRAVESGELRIVPGIREE